MYRRHKCNESIFSIFSFVIYADFFIWYLLTCSGKDTFVTKFTVAQCFSFRFLGIPWNFVTQISFSVASSWQLQSKTTHFSYSSTYINIHKQYALSMQYKALFHTWKLQKLLCFIIYFCRVGFWQVFCEIYHVHKL